MKFKDIFPDFASFKAYIRDYRSYYDEAIYTDAKILIYFTLLYRYYGNSHIAFDNEVFLEQLAFTIEEHFREFFIIRDLLDLVASKEVAELIVGVETITNRAENPNIDTNKDTILNYIGTQQRSKTYENLVDRVYVLTKRIRNNELTTEMNYYKDLFLKIIPRECYLFPEEEEDETT